MLVTFCGNPTESNASVGKPSATSLVIPSCRGLVPGIAIPTREKVVLIANPAISFIIPIVLFGDNISGTNIQTSRNLYFNESKYVL